MKLLSEADNILFDQIADVLFDLKNKSNLEVFIEYTSHVDMIKSGISHKNCDVVDIETFYLSNGLQDQNSAKFIALTNKCELLKKSHPKL